MDRDTKAGHTPGPWHTRGAGTERAWVYAGNVAIASARHASGHDCEANARLIAAAPDLLEACIEALPYLETTAAELAENYDSDDSAPLADRLRAAIAQAKGDVHGSDLERTGRGEA